MIFAQDPTTSGPERFQHILDAAVLCDMPRLLACCECYIADHSNNVDLQGLEQHLPGDSMLRIVAALQKTHRQFEKIVRREMITVPELPNAQEHLQMAQCNTYAK